MLSRTWVFAAACLLAACGGGGGRGDGASDPPPPVSQFRIGGTVTGLNGSLVLQLNNAETLTVNGDGAFAFSQRLAPGSSYQVSVITQPGTQQCFVTSGSGAAFSNVSAIQISCSNVPPPLRTVSGSVLDLTGTLMLRLNEGNTLVVSSNGSFSFPMQLPQGSPYLVTVVQQPTGQLCQLISASGTVGDTDPHVGITCVNTYSVGFSFSGVIGALVVSNGSDEQTISSMGTGTVRGYTYFSTQLPSGATYDIRIRTAPTGQQCTLSGGSGTVTNSDVIAASIVCETIVPVFTVGGVVTGLNGTLSLRNNTSDRLTLSANGGFVFGAPLREGAGYNVTIESQPPAQRCAVSAGSGTVHTANITTVTISCVDLVPHTVGGRLLGVTSPIVLRNNGENALTLADDGAFTFTTPVLPGSGYEVTASSADANQACHVASGAGTMPDEAVANVTVVCSTQRATRFAYVVNTGDRDHALPGSISQYSVGANGALIALSPATVSAGVRPLAITVHPSGRFVYVRSADADSGGATSYWQYAVDSSGVLTAMATASVSGGNAPGNLVIHPSGAYAYAARAGDVLRYPINADGSLAAPSVQNLTSTGYALRSIAFDRAGEHAYVTGADSGGNGAVYQFSLADDGSLVAMSPATIDPGLPFVQAVLAEPFDRFVYAVDGGFSRIAQFRRTQEGMLRNINPSTYNATLFPGQITSDPFGRFAYTAAPGSISIFGIDSTGVLVPGTPDKAGALSEEGFASIAVDLAGEYLYATSSGSSGNWVHQYRIGSDGALTRIDAGSIATGIRPGAIALTP